MLQDELYGMEQKNKTLNPFYSVMPKVDPKLILGLFVFERHVED